MKTRKDVFAVQIARLVLAVDDGDAKSAYAAARAILAVATSWRGRTKRPKPAPAPRAPTPCAPVAPRPLRYSVNDPAVARSLTDYALRTEYNQRLCDGWCPY